jgi:hypothetical protein
VPHHRGQRRGAPRLGHALQDWAPSIPARTRASVAD